MSVVLDFTVEKAQFTLGRILSGEPSMHIELERIVPTEHAIMPFLWVTGEDFDAFEEKVLESGYVDDLEALDRIEDSVLYRIEWRGNHNDIIQGITESEGTILEAYAEDHWEYHVRFADHDRLSQFHNYCTDNDIHIHIDRTYTLTERTESVHQFGLSNEQREALILALRSGYFDTPSEVSLDDLAAELDISQQALSNRVRRGTKEVLSKALLSTSSDLA